MWKPCFRVRIVFLFARKCRPVSYKRAMAADRIETVRIREFGREERKNVDSKTGKILKVFSDVCNLPSKDDSERPSGQSYKVRARATTTDHQRGVASCYEESLERGTRKIIHLRIE
jgi:hypothetical protein